MLIFFDCLASINDRFITSLEIRFGVKGFALRISFCDGGVDVFYSAKIPAGDHYLSLKMNDSVRVEGFNHLLEQAVTIEPTHILLVSFESKHGFVLKPAQD